MLNPIAIEGDLWSAQISTRLFALAKKFNMVLVVSSGPYNTRGAVAESQPPFRR